jgi:hypothetical protein
MARAPLNRLGTIYDGERKLTCGPLAAVSPDLLVLASGDYCSHIINSVRAAASVESTVRSRS